MSLSIDTASVMIGIGITLLIILLSSAIALMFSRHLSKQQKANQPPPQPNINDLLGGKTVSQFISEQIPLISNGLEPQSIKLSEHKKGEPSIEAEKNKEDEPTFIKTVESQNKLMSEFINEVRDTFASYSSERFSALTKEANITPLVKDVSELMEMVEKQNLLMRGFIDEIKELFSRGQLPPTTYPTPVDFDSLPKEEPIEKPARKKRVGMFSKEEIEAEIFRKREGVIASTDLTGGTIMIKTVEDLEAVREGNWYKEQSKAAYRRLWNARNKEKK
jgi:hypothetical protein